MEFLKYKCRELNELTNYDIVLIKSSIEAIYNQSYQCGKCVKKVDEEFREKRKGCTGKYAFKKPLMDGFFYTICPGNFYADAYGGLVDVHRLFRKGVMAGYGGMLDQSSKYLDAMNFIENLVIEKETEQLKKSFKNVRK